MKLKNLKRKNVLQDCKESRYVKENRIKQYYKGREQTEQLCGSNKTIISSGISFVKKPSSRTSRRIVPNKPGSVTPERDAAKNRSSSLLGSNDGF